MQARRILYMGLGEMGYRIAGRLQGRFSVKVWNRTNAKAEAHAEEFGTQAVLGTNPFEKDQSDVDYFMSCLPTSQEIGTFVDHLLKSPYAIKPGSIWLDNTSGVPKSSQEFAGKLNEKQVQFIDVPVSGGRRGAADGNLCVMVGGPKKTFLEVKELLDIVGNKVIHIDERVGSANAVKGLNNLVYGCNLAMAMKAAQAVEKLQLDPAVALQAIVESSGGSTAMQRTRTFVMNNRSIDYRFKAHGLIKDMAIGMDLIDKQEGTDPVMEVFKTVKQAYTDMAKTTDWEEADIFDIFHFIEKGGSC